MLIAISYENNVTLIKIYYLIIVKIKNWNLWKNMLYT